MLLLLLRSGEGGVADPGTGPTYFTIDTASLSALTYVDVEPIAEATADPAIANIDVEAL